MGHDCEPKALNGAGPLTRKSRRGTVYIAEGYLEPFLLRCWAVYLGSGEYT
jgi:hypothetical protein